MNNPPGLFDKTWQGKQGLYTVIWCDLCNAATIGCLETDCHGSTCNGGGCDKCKEDHAEFATYKTNVYHYLTKEEREVYDKALSIQQFIMNTVPEGMKELDWKKLDDAGCLSDYDRWNFMPDVYGKRPVS